MLGSTIVFIPELPEDLSDLYERIVENEEFETLDLDCLSSLDFAIITGKDNTKWNSVKDPVLYNEEAGLVICQISKTGLISVIEYKGDLENIDKETLIHRFSQLDYSGSLNTARQNSMGRAELVNIYTEYLDFINSEI